MAATIRVITMKDLVQFKVDGRIDVDSAKDAMAQIAAAAAALDGSNIILDTREVQSDLSFADIFFLANCLAAYSHAHRHRTAILCAPERFEHVDFLALCAKNRGLYFNAFTSYEEAMAWLMGEAKAGAPGALPPVS